MTVGVFANCTFCLKVKHLPRQQKKKLQTDIKENGGNSSFLLHPQCTHVILDSVDALSHSQLNYIQKNHIHIASPDFIWESIKERRLLDVKNYDPNKSPDSTQPSCQEASSSEVKTDALSPDSSTETESAEELTKFYTENVEIPHFPQEFEVAKYNTLEKVGTDGGQETAVVELQCSQDPGGPAFRISAHFLAAGGTQTRRQLSVKPTSADASECYENYIEELKKQGFLLREHFTPEATQLASEKLQALLLEEVIHSSAVSREVSDLVEMMWAEALGHLEHTLLASVNSISLNDVSKAEGILLLARAALKNGEPEEQLQKMMREFYRLIPHRGTTAEDVDLRLLATKEDLCQLIRDMVNVCETNLSKPNPPSLAKYRALRCKIEHVEQDTEEFFRIRNEVLQSNRSQSPVDILQIFRVGRVSETTEFVRQLGNVKPLLHGSAVRSFVGILSRGLLLPKVVEDRGVKRTDIGSLGSGIYFSDSLSTSTKYSHPGETDGTRLLAVCDIALGRCVDLHKRDFSLTEAPPGYDSVHGVQGTATVTTDFEDDEFVVYKTNQVKMKYIIKFCLPGDEIKDFHPCNNTELEEYIPEVSNFSKIDDDQFPDSSPPSSVKAGLQDASGSPVPLEDVHIKGKIIDFVAQVIVFQTYTNQSHVPIEAKYIFPLDDKAAVCGFEAFINGKHIVGEIKEKEAAHREYREAVREGHGAYLMDQDAPDVFTVSVGNLPPKAKVLIKITYITELSIQGTVAVFFLPATVAPWQQDKALNENIQDTVEKICIKEIGTKQSFSLSMSIEMPYVIEFVSSDTHELKKKITDCKAVISTVEGSSLDSNGFSLQVGLSDAYLPRMWVEKHPEKESEACMLVFQPDLGVALPDVAEESEVILCLDCSNSMEGATFLQAQQIALHALSLVGEKQTVNVVRFGSGYKELFSYPKCITSSDVPTEFVKSASPTMGNTDFWKTLRYLSLLSPSRGLRNILLISDGHLQNEGLTLQLVKRHVRHSRLFSCGVGSTANRHVLRTLSQCGAGVFEYFNSKSKHNWKKQIEDQMARSRSPSCRSVSVKWQQLSPEAPEPLQAPARVQALFHGDRLLVYGLVPHCTQATLCALIQEKEFSTVVSTTELQKTTGTLIHKLTARALIRDHEDGILHENETNHEMKKQILKSLIIQLSKENSLITQFTSFVAVEKRDGNEAPFPNTPNTLELIAKEDVDFLPYMSWQEEEPDAIMLLQPLSASFEWHEEFQRKHLTKRKCKTSEVEVFEDFEVLGSLEEPLPVSFERRDVEKPLDLSRVDSFKHPGIRAQFSEVMSAPMAVASSSAAPAPASFAAAPYAAAPPRPLSFLPQSSLLDSAASPSHPFSFLPQSSLLDSAAAPPSPLSFLPQSSHFGSPYASPGPLSSLPQSSLLDSAASPSRPFSSLPQSSLLDSAASPSRPFSFLPQNSHFGSPAAPPHPLSFLPQSSHFGSPAAPPHPLSFLPQSSHFGSPAAPLHPLSFLPQSSHFGSPAAPPHPLSSLPQSSHFGSPAAPPRPLSSLSQSSHFGSPAHPKQFGPSKTDQDLEIGHGTDSFLKWGSPPRLPHFSSFTDLKLAGGLFGSRQFDPPVVCEGPAAGHCAGISLELDSPRQQSLLCSPPAPPPPGPTKGSGFHLLPGSSPLHLPSSLAPLSTSHKQPVMHPVSLDIPARSVSSDSSQHAFLDILSNSETERDESSFETEGDKTPGFLESGFLKKVAKPDITRRDFTASFLAQTDEEDIPCKQSRRNSVPWTELFNLQTEDGFWKLTPELGFILNLDINILNNFLEQKGIRSLGVRGRERLLDLIATLLVLQLLRTAWEREGAAVTSLMKLDDASISRNFTWAFEEIKKASEWVRRTEGQYPCICQRLELGKDWDSATKQLLGIQPINATSPLHRVLNYSQG